MITIEKKDDIESQARTSIVDIATNNNLYFVCWDGHFGRYFHALNNASKKKPEIYSAIYESYYDLVGNDLEVFKFRIPDQVCWIDLLNIIKAYVPAYREQMNKAR